MQLRQVNKNKIFVKDLWNVVFADVEYFVKTKRFLPCRYLPFLSQKSLMAGVDKIAVGDLAEKIYWYRLTGGHLALKNLFKIHDYEREKKHVQAFDFKIVTLLGYGRDAVVYAVEKDYALKVVAAENKSKLKQEFVLLKNFTCDNIVQVYEYLESAHGAAILQEKIMPQLGCACDYFYALEYLHKKGICHGDIRYSNLGSGKNGQAKLIDFGNSFYGSEKMMQEETETLAVLLEQYCPPGNFAY